MKIRYASATGCPAGQFLVEAENDAERAVLRQFVNFPDYAKDNWRFHLHGWSAQSGVDGIVAFNFGWAKAEDASG